MSASEDEVARHQKKEAYNHELVTSEDFYVSEMEAIITHIVQPLSGSASRCNIKEGEIDFVFGIMQHILQFHLQFLRIIRDELSVIHSFATYIGFITMYQDYFTKYSSMIDVVATWSESMEFREFIKLRLKNEKCAKYIDHRLCSLPWYLYRPLLRIKEYYRFFKDLGNITHASDDEYDELQACKKSIRRICNEIRRSDVDFIKKTRLLEIQLQIFGNTVPIVTDDRYFVYNRMCQVMVSSGIKSHKYKHIHLYIFNDGLLWCSKRGQFKKYFGFIYTNLVYGIPSASTTNDPMLFIQYGSKHKSKLNKKKRKKHYQKHASSQSASASFSLSSKMEISRSHISDIEEDKENDSIPIIDQMAVNHAKPTKKQLLVFVNEKARDECLEKMKHTHMKYIKKLSKKHIHTINHKSHRYLSAVYSDEHSRTFSHTEESSFIDINLNHKPLESHKYNASMSTPTGSNTLLNDADAEQSDDTEQSHSKSSCISQQSATASQNGSAIATTAAAATATATVTTSNCMPMTMPNLRTLKQSVSTEITTIKEEDEDDLKTELH